MKPLVVITGASSGFGAEIAKLFAADNYPLLLLGRRQAKLAALSANFENAMIDTVDVTNYHQFETAVRKAEAKYGKTDLLVNNAGLMLLGNVQNQDPQEWQTMLNTNVMGVLNGTQIVLNDMRDREHGTILNMSSLAGKKTFVNHAAYVASSLASTGYRDTPWRKCAEERARHAGSPGAAETELLTHVTSKSALSDYEAWKASMGGLTLDPKHVAATVKFMYDMPQNVNIREVDIAATAQDA